jgi:SAM-dependent methyltransferase
VVDQQFATPELAALYDELHPAGERNDFRFYLPLVMAAPSVLDVGCGTGELLRIARAQGHRGRLAGIDPADAMLDRARQCPDIDWILGEVSSIARDQAFDLIVMTGHAFQVLLDDDELRAALSAIRSLLTAGGHFVFETRNPAAQEWLRWTPDRAVDVVRANGSLVRMAHEVHTPVVGELVSFTTTFSSPDWEAPRRSHSMLRFLGVDALASLLADTRLEIEVQVGDWDARPLTAASPEIITIARPAPRSVR